MGVSKKRLCAWGAPRCRLVIQPCPGQYLHQGLVGGTACSYHVGPEVHLGQLDGKVAHAASAALDQHARARPGHAPRLQSLLRKDTNFELARRSVWLPRLCPCMATAVTRLPALYDARARLWHASRLQSLLRMGTDHEHGCCIFVMAVQAISLPRCRNDWASGVVNKTQAQSLPYAGSCLGWQHGSACMCLAGTCHWTAEAVPS